MSYAENELDFVTKYLVKAAEGVILWVVLVIDELYYHIKRGFWTLQEIRAKLFSLPKDLEETYSEIIVRLKSHSEDELTRSRLMLMWASFSKRTLTAEEFRDAMAASSSFDLSPIPPSYVLNENRFGNLGMLRRAIVQRCGGLLEIIRPSSKESVARSFSTSDVEVTDTVQLIHQTVKDFLLFDSRTGSFHLDKSECQYWIDDACFTYLVLSVSVHNLQDKPVSSWHPNDYDLFVHHLRDRPLLSYIFSFCPQHHLVRSALGDFLQFLAERPRFHPWCLLESWCRQEHLLPYVPPAYERRFKATCLTAAARAGYSNVVQMLLVYGGNINIDDISVALEAAANRGQNDAANVLIDSCSGQGIIEAFSKGLFAAVEKGHEKMVRRLLESGHVRADNSRYSETGPNAAVERRRHEESLYQTLVKVNSAGPVRATEIRVLHRDPSLITDENKNPEEETLLSVACKYGHSIIAGILIAAGARVSEDALQRAVKYDHPDLVNLLVTKGGRHEDALRFAAQYGRVEITKLLLARWAYSYEELLSWKWLNSPLHNATQYGHQTILRLLLARGRENALDNDPQLLPNRKWKKLAKKWETALHVAIEYSQNGAMQVLLEGGLNANGRRAFRDTTALHLSARMGHKQAAHMLLSFGADITTQDMFGRTPLHEAVRHGHAKVVDELLQWSPDVERWDEDTFTALHHSLRCGHSDIMRTLLEHGVDANGQDGLGRTPLHYSTTLDAANLLLTHKADVNLRDIGGRTPLHGAAAATGLTQLVSFLIWNGADVLAQDDAGRTPLDDAGIAFSALESPERKMEPKEHKMEPKRRLSFSSYPSYLKDGDLFAWTSYRVLLDLPETTSQEIAKVEKPLSGVPIQEKRSRYLDTITLLMAAETAVKRTTKYPIRKMRKGIK